MSQEENSSTDGKLEKLPNRYTAKTRAVKWGLESWLIPKIRAKHLSAATPTSLLNGKQGVYHYIP